MIYRASTNEQAFTFPIVVSDMADIQITYRQDGQIVFEKHKADLDFTEDGKTCGFSMTQEEANMFHVGIMEVQARVLSEDGACEATQIVRFLVREVLHDNIMGE